VIGAQALAQTLVTARVDTCFMNPGTSEMHLVAALDAVPELHGVLALFEGVATGAADGYARMAGRPAAALLHLGPGLGNGLANLHNARKAHTPIVNIVGDHALAHQAYDAQLQSDIETVARNVSTFVRSSGSTAGLARDTADAVAAAIGPPGQVATLIVPADVSWSDGAEPAPPTPPATPSAVSEDAVTTTADALRSGRPVALLVGGRACRADVLATVADIAAATGARVLCETFPARLERGAGVVPVERLAYLAEFAMTQMDGLAHLVLVDAKSPVSFFAYPDKPSNLVPDGCAVHPFVGPADDLIGALDALAAALDAKRGQGARQDAERPEPPTGPLTAQSLCAAVGALLPEGAIISDEGNTSGLFLAGATAGAPPHDLLTLTGGAIGQGLPVAVGAATACPDRRVLALEADGSALYTLQSWWTMAREGLDVTTVILNNSSYAVLNMELNRVGADEPGPLARDMLSLRRPDLDFVALAHGMGLHAARATTSEELTDELARALATPGPSVVEALVPSII
jgi:acetolactate synthase-1/2/3 large subunit